MAASYDLAVSSRRIYTGSHWVSGTIAVRDGQVAGLFASERRVQAQQLIEAGDQLVIPGLIDTHAHFRDPGFTDKEDFLTGTQSAAAGGVTTVFDMPNVDPPTNTQARFLEHIANAGSKAVVDFGHNASATVVDEIGGIAAAGASAFKIFMMTDLGRDYPHMPGTAVSDHGELLRICEAVADTGLPLYVHPHDQAIYELFVQRAWAEWGRDFRSYARAWREGDGLVLDAGIGLMLHLQRVTGVQMHFLHMSTVEGIRMVNAAKKRGAKVSFEVNPFALFVTNSWAEIEKLGPYALGMWVPEEHAAATWKAIRDGSADVIATDHSPHTREEKESGWADMFAAPGGSPMIEHYLSLLLTAVHEGRVPLERVVDLVATNPAKLANVYPRKGRIAPGSDADMVIVDPDVKWTVRAENSYAKCGWTPLEGRILTGKPVMTISRGEIVMRDGVVLGRPGRGDFVGLATPA